MKKLMLVLVVALSWPIAAMAKDQGGGGTSGTECKYCRWNIWGQNYSCPTTKLVGKKGDCEIVYHMGEYICRMPPGPQCLMGDPVPSPPPVVQ